MKTLARIISAIFSPLMCPTYGVLVAILTSILAVLPPGILWTSVLVTFVTTCLLPAVAILVLYKMGYVSDTGLNNRTERTYPYVITLLCYLGCALFFYRANAPHWLWLFLAGGGAACLVNIIVNRWWKISAHAAGMAGIIALVFRITLDGMNIVPMQWWISGTILATGLVMSARVFLERHTLWQVIAGAANGFLCVYLITMF